MADAAEVCEEATELCVVAIKLLPWEQGRGCPSMDALQVESVHEIIE